LLDLKTYSGHIPKLTYKLQKEINQMNMPNFLYHLCLKEDWSTAQAAEGYYGSQKDKSDGFIHMSTAEQVQRSAGRYYEKNPNLILLEVDPTKVVGEIKWEPSSRGELYAHIYGHIPHDAISNASPLPLDTEGKHIFPDLNE
jgi:uncharacterized protein (DUF952 family)